MTYTMKKRRARFTGHVVVVLCAFSLVAGCSGGSHDPLSSNPAEPAVGEPVSQVEGIAVAYGEPARYGKGLSLVVSEPRRFRPSADALTGNEEDFVKVRVRLVNRTDKLVSASNVSVSVETVGGQGADIIDGANRMVGGPPSAKIRPGGSASWVLGFGLIDTKDITVHVQPGLNSDPITFES
jgi:hypothetical protein